MSDQPKHTFTLELTDVQALLVANAIYQAAMSTKVTDMTKVALYKADRALRDQVLAH